MPISTLDFHVAVQTDQPGIVSGLQIIPSRRLSAAALGAPDNRPGVLRRTLPVSAPNLQCCPLVRPSYMELLSPLKAARCPHQTIYGASEWSYVMKR